jgi:Cu-Zn family superoxide dismutase
MTRHNRLLRCVAAAVTTMVLAAGCATAAPSSGPPAVATPTAIPRYTLEDPWHRNPMGIAWHDESQSFFVGTYFDGSLYRGRLDDPTVRVFLAGWPGQAAEGIKTADGRLYVAGGLYGEIRIYDLDSRARAGSFATGHGGALTDLVVTDTGHVWVTDGVRPVLWHLTPEQVAAGSGTSAAVPVSPEIAFDRSKFNLGGIVALSEQQLVVLKYNDGTFYRIDLDANAPDGRTITRIDGATVRQGGGMILDGGRLVIADDDGLSIVELSEDVQRATLVRQVREPPFKEATTVTRARDRYLVVNADFRDNTEPFTITSVLVEE